MGGLISGRSELLVCTVQAVLCTLEAIGKGLPDCPLGYAALKPVKHGVSLFVMSMRYHSEQVHGKLMAFFHCSNKDFRSCALGRSFAPFINVKTSDCCAARPVLPQWLTSAAGCRQQHGAACTADCNGHACQLGAGLPQAQPGTPAGQG